MRLRFWLVQIMLPAALINAVANVVAGRAFYPAGHAVPMVGARSVTGDVLVGAFLIGFFSWLVLPRAGANEARAGRVRGRGRRVGWLRWAIRHRLLGGVGFGLAVLVATGLPAALALGLGLAGELARDTFLALKVGFAVVVGTAAALVAAFAGVLPEDDASADPRWCRDPAALTGVAYPCQPADKGCVAITDAARGCSITPTWQLVVSGALDEQHLRQALAALAGRYPSLRTRVQALDGAPPLSRRLRYAEDPAFTVDAIFEIVDLRAEPTRLAAALRELCNRPLDLFVDFPVTLSWLRLGDASSRLVLRQHHAIADGRAFIGLLVDFAAFLDAARAGRPAPTLPPIGRRPELDGLGVTGLRRAAWTVAGYGLHLGAILRAVLRPTTPLYQNRGLDYRGDNATLHWAVDQAVLDGWQARRKALGVSLNSLLTAALLAANRRWHDAMGLGVGRTQAILAMETRPRARDFASFANHLGAFVVTVALDHEAEVAALAARVHAQVQRQRATHAPEKRLLSQAQLVGLMTLADIHRVLYQQPRPLTNVDFSNLIALEFPALGGAGWSVDEVLITTPVVPRTGIVLTAIAYRGRVVFNLNYKSSVVSREEAAALLQHLQAALA